MRLIDADEIKYKKSKFDTVYRSPEDMSLWHEKRKLEWVAKEDIDDMPTIEAEPVRHGTWIIIYNDNKPFKAICSECGAVLLFTSKHEGEPKYCHNCGCKMDKEST